MRQLHRECSTLAAEEAKYLAEMRLSAKTGQMSTVRVIAKDLVRSRNQRAKLQDLHSQLRAVQMRLQSVRSTRAVADTIKVVSAAMIRVNRELNLPELQNITDTFTKESLKLDVTEEMMHELVDDAITDENHKDNELEEQAAIQKCLEELGVDLSGEFLAVNSPNVTTNPPLGLLNTVEAGQPIAMRDSTELPPFSSKVGEEVLDSNENRDPLSSIEEAMEQRLKNLRK